MVTHFLGRRLWTRALFTVLAATVFTNTAVALNGSQPVSESAASCDHASLTPGLALQISSDGTVWIDEAGGFVYVRDGGRLERYRLADGGRDAKREQDVPPVARPVNLAELPLLPLVAGKEHATPLASGRTIFLSRLHSNILHLKIPPLDTDMYRAFVTEVAGGTYCRQSVATLPDAVKSQVRPLVRYMMYDLITSGRLDEYKPWEAFQPVATATLEKKTLTDIMSVYGFRATELVRSDPELARMDPAKFWAFAWNAVALLFKDKEAHQFTDLIMENRNGGVSLAIAGTAPIEGGHGNRFSFYTKPLGKLDASAVKLGQSLDFTWKQGAADYRANLKVTNGSKSDIAAPTAFHAGLKRGIVLLDQTLPPKELNEIRSAYVAYYAARGYVFSDQKAVDDIPASLLSHIASGSADYLIKDGHSDGDDENAFVAYATGYVLTGRRPEKDVEETIDIYFTTSKKTPERRIAYRDFVAALEHRFAKTKTMLVYIDASCWGIEKTWVSAGFVAPSRLLQIAADTSVNFMQASRLNTSKILLDGLLAGESFSTVRRKMMSSTSYASGVEDRFIFPDQRSHPTSGPVLRLERSIQSRAPGAEWKPYTSEGYF